MEGEKMRWREKGEGKHEGLYFQLYLSLQLLC